jgi:hypothetical protein
VRTLVLLASVSLSSYVHAVNDRIVRVSLPDEDIKAAYVEGDPFTAMAYLPTRWIGSPVLFFRISRLA